MSNLLPGGLYAYRVGSNAFGWSSQSSFQAKKTLTDASRLLIYGDFGVGDQILATLTSLIAEIDTHTYDAVIHNGDLAYDLDDDYGQRGDTFLRSIEPVASRVPYMLAQGNHESGLVLPHYTNRFQMPGNSSNLWYSFNSGKAHFIAYNTELVFDNLTETQALQMEFLQKDLESVDRTEFPWLVVYGHRPLYCSANMSDSLLSDEWRIRLNPTVRRGLLSCEGFLRNFGISFRWIWWLLGMYMLMKDLARFIRMSRCPVAREAIRLA